MFFIALHKTTCHRLFVGKMMMAMMCNNILHYLFFLNYATKVKHPFDTTKDLSQNLLFFFQIKGKTSSDSTSHLVNCISFCDFSREKVK